MKIVPVPGAMNKYVYKILLEKNRGANYRPGTTRYNLAGTGTVYYAYCQQEDFTRAPTSLRSRAHPVFDKLPERCLKGCCIWTPGSR